MGGTEQGLDLGSGELRVHGDHGEPRSQCGHVGDHQLHRVGPETTIRSPGARRRARAGRDAPRGGQVVQLAVGHPSGDRLPGGTVGSAAASASSRRPAGWSRPAGRHPSRVRPCRRPYRALRASRAECLAAEPARYRDASRAQGGPMADRSRWSTIWCWRRPHLVAHECTDCGARFFDRRNACAALLRRPSSRRSRSRPRATVRAFTIVAFAAPGIPVPFVAAVVDCDGTSVRANLINVEPDPEHVTTGHEGAAGHLLDRHRRRRHRGRSASASSPS